MGLLAFWFTDISVLDSLYWGMRLLFAGQLLPVSFFSGWLEILAKLLPFRYMYSFILEVYFGKITPSQIFFGVVMQVAWLVLFLLMYRVMLEKGRRVYSAYGN